MPRNYYARDPHWIVTRYPSQCQGCQGRIGSGARAFYWPSTKTLDCARCGETSSARFEAEAADEYAMEGY